MGNTENSGCVTTVTDCEPNLLAGSFSVTNHEFLPLPSLMLSLKQLSDMGCPFLINLIVVEAI